MAATVGHAWGARHASAWEAAQAWRAFRRAMRDRFLADSTVVRTDLAKAAADQIQGAFDHIIEVAVDRINAAAKSKAAAAAPAAAANARPLATKVYAGGSTIDLDKDLITLADGTTIDLHTGAKVDVTV
jgi:hypothetical protein